MPSQVVQGNDARNSSDVIMERKQDAIRKAAVLLMGVVLALTMTAAAQEIRSEVSIQGTGFFTSSRDNAGFGKEATDSGGILVGYRYNVNRWLAAEANYGLTQNSQLYFGSLGGARVQANVHEITGSAIAKLPTIANVQLYALAGGGALVFDPTDAIGNFIGATRETTGTFLYGVGGDYNFTRHFAIRAEYRGFIYKAPSFNLSSLNSDTWTYTAQPSAGIVFKF